MDFEPHIDSGKFEFTKVDIADLSPGEFASQVQRAVEQKGASLIVIDSLTWLLTPMSFPD